MQASCRWLGVVILSIYLPTAPPLPAQADQHPKIDLDNGWQSLFNGRDLTGWVTRDSDGKPAPANTWAVEDGAIARKGGAYLWSAQQYGDFILDLEFKVAPETNSGIILRHTPEYSAGQRYWWNGLLEVQILDSYGQAKPGMQDCGSLYDMIAPAHNTMKKPGEWNRITITAKGSRIVVVMNGQQIIDADLDDWSEAGKNPDGTPNKYHKPMKDVGRKGFILLQDHGRPVWFRNVHVKPLD
jgi:hypothetical protein